MPAAAIAVAGIAVGADSASRQRSAQRDAADGIEDANIQSATQLAAAGAAGEIDISDGARLARNDIQTGRNLALEAIGGDYRSGKKAFNAYEDHVLNDDGMNLAFHKGTRHVGRVGADTNIYGDSDFTKNEIDMQSWIATSGLSSKYRDLLQGQAAKGVASIDDVAGIKNRSRNNLARIGASQGAQRASALIGQGPQLQQLGQGAIEARALGDIADRNYRSSLVTTAAGAAGDYWGSK